mgnify:CR=1 FL=1
MLSDGLSRLGPCVSSRIVTGSEQKRIERRDAEIADVAGEFVDTEVGRPFVGGDQQRDEFGSDPLMEGLTDNAECQLHVAVIGERAGKDLSKYVEQLPQLGTNEILDNRLAGPCRFNHLAHQQANRPA